ncbi:fluoride efflux transporter FluC [Agromyces soli]
MSPAVFLLAVLGGGVGAAIRFVVDGLVMRHVHSGYPWGTFVINTTGSFLLGLLTGMSDSSLLSSSWLFVLGEGVMGGYTTFSTATIDTVHLLQKRRFGRALWSSVGLIVVGVTAAVIGLQFGSRI